MYGGLQGCQESWLEKIVSLMRFEPVMVTMIHSIVKEPILVYGKANGFWNSNFGVENHH